jgi:hypothetical protein
MKPAIRIGLLTGAIALIPAICATLLSAVCGPVAAVVAGAAAGFFTGKNKETMKSDAVRLGATAGALSGIIVFLAQLVGVALTLVYFQTSGAPSIFGTAVPSSADPAAQMGYYVGGLATGFCFGGVGLVLAAVAGAGTAYMAAPEKPGF